MIKKVLLLLALLTPSLCMAQAFQTGFVYRGPLINIPASCVDGTFASITDAAAGQLIYECKLGAWTQQLNNGGDAVNPALFDITKYGARGTTSYYGWPSTTAACNGTTTLTGDFSAFVNGDGIKVPDCGATSTLIAPSSLSVVPSVVTADTGTENVATVASGAPGSTTYSYKIVAISKTEAFTAPSSITSTTTGVATLGAYSVSFSGCTRSAPLSQVGAGSLVTCTTSARSPEVLAVGEAVHISTSDSTFNGRYNIYSLPDSTHFTYYMGLSTADPTVTTSVGSGTAKSFNVNRIAWTGHSGDWQYAVCKNISGTYTLVGTSMPQGDTGITDTTYDDYGTMQANFLAPNYFPADICTGSGHNNYLSTTIVSGGGSGSSVVVTDTASQTKASVTAVQDDCVGIKAAASASYNSSAAGVVYIPTGASGVLVFNINSFCDPLPAMFRQSGQVWLNETFEMGAGSKWRADIDNGGYGPFQFGAAGFVPIKPNGVRPGFYFENANGGVVNGMEFLPVETNNSLAVVEDDGSNYANNYNQCDLDSGATGNDLMGICYWHRSAGGNAFMHTFDHFAATGDGGSADTTTTPLLVATGTTSNTVMTNTFMVHRGIQWNTPELDMHFFYNQGPIAPMLAITGQGNFVNLDNVTDDTGPGNILTNYNNSQVQLQFGNNIIGGDPSGLALTGFPFWTFTLPQGNASPGSYGQNIYSSGCFPAHIPYPGFTIVNGGVGVYGTCDFNSTVRFPLGNSLLWPVAGPTGVTTSAATSGGSVPVSSTITYKVFAVMPDGGYTASSAVSNTATTTMGNQTVPLSWTGIPWAQGYFYCRSPNGVDYQRINSSPVTGTSTNDTSAGAADQDCPTQGGGGILSLQGTNSALAGKVLAATGTAATLTGTGACLTGDLMNQVGGAWAGKVQCTNTTGASTLVVAVGTTANAGYFCSAIDITTPADILTGTPSTTGCSFAGTVAANDYVQFLAVAY